MRTALADDAWRLIVKAACYSDAITNQCCFLLLYDVSAFGSVLQVHCPLICRTDEIAFNFLCMITSVELKLCTRKA